jgi:NAD(P)H-quinone oxidoreductase subunit 4
MGGLAIPVPKIFTTFSILSMASLALPGMSGFVWEQEFPGTFGTFHF